ASPQPVPSTSSAIHTASCSTFRLTAGTAPNTSLESVSSDECRGMTDPPPRHPTLDPRLAPSRSCGNDREKKIRSAVGTNVQSGFARENLPRPVARIVVQERPTTFKFVLEV